ncbi:MAG TPA: endonuclease/exonuclease/phosphatase family protein [Propionibacteriaceae bacterium]|nr:endonuclease/exonuclease/phosphatase family protein [Propionibacteriaceae bacterium]
MNAVMVVGPGHDTRHRPTAGQGILLTLAGLLLIPAVASTVMRLIPPTDDATALVASFIAYGVIPYAGALLCLVVALIRARRRLALAVVSGIVALLTVLHLAWLGPLFVPDQRVARTPPFTVMSLNMYFGSADPGGVAEMAQRADVVILVEVTPDALQALEGRAWNKRFPYSIGSSEEGVGGTAVYSRFRLSRAERIGVTEFQQWAVEVQVPGVGPVELLAVHPCNPYCGGGRWYSDHQLISNAAAEYRQVPMIVAGDFNAVPDHGPMQQLRRMGLRSADDIVGAGWMPTYPARRRLPPLLPIDNVLVNDRLTATSVTSFRVRRTDHLGLLATLAGT